MYASPKYLNISAGFWWYFMKRSQKTKHRTMFPSKKRVYLNKAAKFRKKLWNFHKIFTKSLPNRGNKQLIFTSQVNTTFPSNVSTKKLWKSTLPYLNLPFFNLRPASPSLSIYLSFLTLNLERPMKWNRFQNLIELNLIFSELYFSLGLNQVWTLNWNWIFVCWHCLRSSEQLYRYHETCSKFRESHLIFIEFLLRINEY